MILGIEMPEGAKIEFNSGKLLIIFDEDKTKRDLWIASLNLWLTKGNTVKSFHLNDTLSCKRLEVTKHYRLKLEG